MDLNKLRELIRTGEFLEENFEDDRTRSQWVFRVEDFMKTLGDTQKLSSELSTLNFHGGKPIARGKFNTIMGYLRNKYDTAGFENRLITKDAQSVFIVHGHDDTLIEEVKGCVSSLGLEPIVLREQPDKGLTIIEKLEDWLGNCKCAVVLYTPCDVGRAVDETEDEQRARQNVVYEHGLFQGYLGRKRILTLKKGDTRPPGDCSGVVYTSVEDNNWQDALKKNIQAIDNGK